MTQAEYHAITRAFENVESREKSMCKDFIRLNPTHKEQRERDRDMFLLGTLAVRYEIQRILK